MILPKHRRAYVPDWSKRRPKVDNISLAVANTVLCREDLMKNIWSMVTKDFPQETPETALLAAEWLSLFTGNFEDMNFFSPAFPLGLPMQWGKLSELELLKDFREKRSYPAKGLPRSTWDMLFLAAITPQSLAALADIRDLTWEDASEPVPLRHVTQAVSLFLKDRHTAQIPFELVLAGLHMKGCKMRFQPDGGEPLLYIAIPDEFRPASAPETMPSLFDGGWMRPIPEDLTTDLSSHDRREDVTNMFHLFQAANLLSAIDADHVPSWITQGETGRQVFSAENPVLICDIPFMKNEAASGFSELLKAGRISPEKILAPRQNFSARKKAFKLGRLEEHFASILTIMGEGWLSELEHHQQNSHSFSNDALLPWDHAERTEELLKIYALDGFSLSQARIRTEGLMEGDSFRAEIAEHLDAEDKADIDDLLQGRRGRIGDPLSRFWQMMCLSNPDTSLAEMGVDVVGGERGRSLVSRLRIDGLLFLSERKSLKNLLALAEMNGCRGFVSVGESLIGAKPSVRLLRMRDQTLSLTCVEAGSYEILSRDLFGRIPRHLEKDVADPSPSF